MSGYTPPGMVPFVIALGRVAKMWLPELWAEASPAEKEVLDGIAELPYPLPRSLIQGPYDKIRPFLSTGQLAANIRMASGGSRMIEPRSWDSTSADYVGAVLYRNVLFTIEKGIETKGDVLFIESTLKDILLGKLKILPYENLSSRDLDNFAQSDVQSSTDAQHRIGKRKTGPKPVERERLIEAMRKMDPALLERMKLAELEVFLVAKATTVREARNHVLSNVRSSELRKTANND